MSDENIRQVASYDFITRLIGWTPDRRLIIKSVQSKREPTAQPADTDITGLDPTSTQGKLLTTLKDAYFQNIAMTRDGKRLAFVSRVPVGDTIRTLDLSNNASKTLVEGNDDRLYFANLAFAPDGKMLYYGKQANWQVISAINDFK